MHLLRLDYPTGTAQILDPHWRCVAISSDVPRRADALARGVADGWRLDRGGDWTYTTPPDGRERTIVHIADVTAAAPGPLELDPDASDAEIGAAITAHFGRGRHVLAVVSAAGHVAIHRATLPQPNAPQASAGGPDRTAVPPVPATRAR